MSFGKGIITCVIVLILALSGSSLSQDAAAGIPGYSNAFHHTLSTGKTRRIAVAPGTARKDRVKVRYMGGECGYEAPRLPAIIFSPITLAQRESDSYTSVTSSSNYPLFQLRGPPHSFPMQALT